MRLLHPMLVHFPIALLCVGALWDLFQRDQSDASTGYRLWWWGTGAALVASTAGIVEHFAYREGPWAQTVMQHQLWGLGVTVASLAWAMWRGYQRHITGQDPGRDIAGGLASLLVACAVLWTASGGGALVFEHALGVTRQVNGASER